MGSTQDDILVGGYDDLGAVQFMVTLEGNVDFNAAQIACNIVR